MNSKENQAPRRSPEEIVDKWKERQLKGTLPPGSEPVNGKQYRALVINDAGEGFQKRYVPAASKGGSGPLEQGVLVEVNSKGVPINETIKGQLEMNPDGYTLEGIE